MSTTPPDQLARYFDAELGERVVEPSYNVAPSRDVHSVVEEPGARRLVAQRWGLVPHWAKDPSIGNRMINARAETLSSRPAYREAFRRRRCIIAADGFYEWAPVPGSRRKQPYFIHRRDGEPLALAGLWEQWRDRTDPEGIVLETCTIITGPANEAVARIHDRMPVALPPHAWARWLDPDEHDPRTLQPLLVPVPAEVLASHAVTPDVNRTANDHPGLIEAAPRDPSGGGEPPVSGQSTAS